MLANAVARVENLEFLTDVVPKTTTYKQFKQKQAKEGSSAQANGSLANGQGTLDTHLGAAKEEQATNGASHEVMDVDDDEEEEEVEVVEAESTRSPEAGPAERGDDEMEEHV